MENSSAYSSDREIHSLPHPFRFAEVSLPFVGQFQSGFTPKTSVTIRGTLKRSQESFTVAFKESSANIPLVIHCHPRDTLLRIGHSVDGIFHGNFETDNCGLFVPNGFNLTIHAIADRFLIELNGRVLTTIHLKLPLPSIRFLEITGAVNIIAISSADQKERKLNRAALLALPPPPPTPQAAQPDSTDRIETWADVLLGIAECLVDTTD